MGGKFIQVLLQISLSILNKEFYCIKPYTGSCSELPQEEDGGDRNTGGVREQDEGREGTVCAGKGRASQTEGQDTGNVRRSVQGRFQVICPGFDT